MPYSHAHRYRKFLDISHLTHCNTSAPFSPPPNSEAPTPSHFAVPFLFLCLSSAPFPPLLFFSSRCIKKASIILAHITPPASSLCYHSDSPTPSFSYKHRDLSVSQSPLQETRFNPTPHTSTSRVVSAEACVSQEVAFKRVIQPKDSGVADCLSQ